MSYRINLWPALKYPLGVIQLSKAEVEGVEKLMRPELKKGELFECNVLKHDNELTSQIWRVWRL